MPVISVAGTRVLLAMSPPGVCWCRHGDTGRGSGVTFPRRSDSGIARTAVQGSDLPSGGRTGIRKVGAVRTGADRAAEMLAEQRMVLTDPPHRLADRAGHTGTSALGPGRRPSATPAQAERAGELAHEEVTFGLGLRGLLGVPAFGRLGDVVVDLGQTPP